MFQVNHMNEFWVNNFPRLSKVIGSSIEFTLVCGPVATTSSRHHILTNLCVYESPMSDSSLSVFPLALSPVRILLSLYSGKGHTPWMSSLQWRRLLGSLSVSSWVDSGEGIK